MKNYGPITKRKKSYLFNIKKKSIKNKRKIRFLSNKTLKFILIIILVYIINNISKNNNYINNIHLAINVDKKYLYPSIVFITSLLENKNPSTFYNIHLLASSNSIFEYKNKYNTLINKYGKTSINISYIDMKNDFVEALSGPYISTAAYYRIALSSLLPNLDRIIYCDSDVINFKDLTEMYNLEINDTIYERRIRFLFSLFLN